MAEAKKILEDCKNIEDARNLLLILKSGKTIKEEKSDRGRNDKMKEFKS